MKTNQITITPEMEPKLAVWLATREGIAVWRNCDLGSPDLGMETFTPAMTAGQATVSPHWKNGNTPAFVVTSAYQIRVQAWPDLVRAFDSRILTERKIRLKIGITLPTGLVVFFDPKDPSRCTVWDSVGNYYRVRVKNAFHLPLGAGAKYNEIS